MGGGVPQRGKAKRRAAKPRGAVPLQQPNGCNNRSISVGIEPSRSNWELAFLHEADVDHRGAHRRLACARRALSAGPILSRPPRSMRELKLAAGAAISRRMEFAEKSRRGRNNRHRESRRRNQTSPEDGPPATSDPLTADPPPDEVDEAAWLMIPLLRAAEARWAAMVSPLRDETPPPDPWPWLSVYGLELAVFG